MSRRYAKAFTFVEMLVVIGIIGTLIAILIPAITQSRNAADRCRTLGNLRQSGLALHSYHDVMGKFPMGGLWKTYIKPYLERKIADPTYTPEGTGFTGEGMFGATTLTLTDIVNGDGSSTTFMIVQPYNKSLTAPPVYLECHIDSPVHIRGRCESCFVDGSGRTMPANLSESAARALITWNGGESVSE